jgi:predicted RNA-binding protein
MVDPVTKKAKKVKEVITYIDDNNQKMEMFDVLEDGKEFKSMQVVSKRKM